MVESRWWKDKSCLDRKMRSNLVMDKQVSLNYEAVRRLKWKNGERICGRDF